MKKQPVVPTSFRMKYPISEKLEKLIEANKFPSRNEALNSLLEMGIDAYNEIEIDTYIEEKAEQKEEVPSKTTLTQTDIDRILGESPDGPL
jgi:Arc/MetJ-type ribon-helix-helix transcriptional regulator